MLQLYAGYYNLGTTTVYNFRNWRTITTDFVTYLYIKR